MRRMILLTTALALGASPTRAQDGWMPKAELRPFMGVYVPTAGLRDRFEDAWLVGVQGALEMSRHVHITGAFSWVPGRSGYDPARTRVDVTQYDVGVEWNGVRPTGTAWALHPFVGAGAGARNFEYASDALTDRTCAAGYLSAGAELRLRRVGVRAEVRDNVFCFKSPLPDATSATRNDLWLSLGVALHLP